MYGSTLLNLKFHNVNASQVQFFTKVHVFRKQNVSNTVCVKNLLLLFYQNVITKHKIIVIITSNEVRTFFWAQKYHSYHSHTWLKKYYIPLKHLYHIFQNWQIKIFLLICHQFCHSKLFNIICLPWNRENLSKRNGME